MDPVKLDELIDGIDHESRKEERRDIVPGLAQKHGTLPVPDEHGPAERRPALARVPRAGTKREKRGHHRLNDEPQV